MPAFQKPVQSTAYQAVSLYFTLTLLKFLEGTVLEEDIEDLWAKFTQSLPAFERADSHTGQKILCDTIRAKDYRNLGHLLSPIIQGLIPNTGCDSITPPAWSTTSILTPWLPIGAAFI